MFRVLAIAFAGFTVSAVATYAAILFGTLAAWNLIGVVDRDGGGSMGLAFVIAPSVALISGIAGAIFSTKRALRREQGRPVDPADQRLDASRFAIAGGGLAGGFFGYLIAKFAFWLAGPIRYDAMWKAMAHAWAPMLIVLLGAVGGGLLARRLSRS